MDLVSLKTHLLALLGASYSIDGWEDAVLTEALAQGLADTNVWLPPVEASFSVTEPGYDQDISSLAPIQVLAVAYPWTEGDTFREAAVTWRMAGPGVLALGGVEPTAGMTVRVRFRKRYAVAGLDAATATTLPENAGRALLLAAASHAYLIRYRQLARRPSTAPSDLQSCKDLSDVYHKQFEAAVADSSGSLPAWPQLGL
jgi:hypothetical protein